MAVHVVIPAFNRPKRLHRAVSSVLAQSYQDFSLTVVDDFSSEDLTEARELVESAGHKWKRASRNLGPAAARNLGVTFGGETSQWLAFLDSDDEWAPGKLEAQIKLLDENPKLEIAQCREVWIRDSVQVNQKHRHQMPEGEFFFRSLELCLVSPSSVILSRRLFEEAGGFDERLRICEDYDLWLRIAKSYEIGLVEEALVTKYGGHACQLSRSEFALDRYRVFSLGKILASGELSESQRDATSLVFNKKLGLLVDGAKKRERTADIEHYQKLESRADSGRVPESRYVQAILNSDEFKT